MLNINFKHKLIKDSNNKNQKYIHIAYLNDLLNDIFDYVEKNYKIDDSSICFLIEHINKECSNLKLFINSDKNEE